MSEQISCYDAYELFLHTLNSKPVTEREKALCRAFFQAAWEAKTIELSASQAREAALREKLEAAETENECLSASCRAVTEKLEAAESKIKASQEQEPFMHYGNYEKDRFPLFKQPQIQPEIAELQRENEQLKAWHEYEKGKRQALQEENAELRRLLEESKKTAMEFDAPRIRVVARALGCEEAMPADDETLIGCIGTVMGVFRRKIEESKVPEGWQLVPIEPTDEMLTRGSGYFRSEGNPKEIASALACYRSMLAVAPQPPKVPKQ